MHREPLISDIIRVPGSEAPERVVSVSAETLTLAPLRGEETRTIERPARERIRLVGVAAPARRRPRLSDTMALPDKLEPASLEYLQDLAAHDHELELPAQIAAQVVYGSSGVDPADLF